MSAYDTAAANGITGRHEGLESAQREIDKLKAVNAHEQSRNDSDRKEISYLQERLSDYRRNYGPQSYGSFNERYRYNGSAFQAADGEVFAYNASRATIEVTRDYFEMLQSKAANNTKGKLSYQYLASGVSKALGVKAGEDIVKVAEFNGREKIRLEALVASLQDRTEDQGGQIHSLQERNSWQSSTLSASVEAHLKTSRELANHRAKITQTLRTVIDGINNQPTTEAEWKTGSPSNKV